MMPLVERLEMLERALAELRLLNDTMPVVVEGKRDEEALRRLGVTGQIVFLKATAGAILDVCDALAREHHAVVALPDWDRTGGRLMRMLRDNLAGRVELNRDIRRTFARYAEVATVEALPSYLETLRDKISAGADARPT